MNRSLLFLFLIHFFGSAFAQGYDNSSFLQGGLTLNFLYNVDKDQSAPIGGSTSYYANEFKPLPGFVTGIVRHQKIGSSSMFFRFGILLDYKVSIASLNSYSYNGFLSSSEKQNVETRFRNLYIVIPSEFGWQFGKGKALYVFGGFNFGFRVANESNWNYMYTQSSYDWNTNPPDTTTIGPTEQQEKPETFSGLIAIEAGFGKMITSTISIEARTNAGLNLMCEIGSWDKASLKQITGEIVLGWKLKKKESK